MLWPISFVADIIVGVRLNVPWSIAPPPVICSHLLKIGKKNPGSNAPPPWSNDLSGQTTLPVSDRESIHVQCV